MTESEMSIDLKYRPVSFKKKTIFLLKPREVEGCCI